MLSNDNSSEGKIPNSPSTPTPSEQGKGMAWIDKCAAVVLVAVILTALSIIGMLAYNKFVSRPNVPPATVSFVIRIDSAGVITPASRAEANKILEAMEVREHLLKDKYEHILQQKENVQDYFTWGSILVTIVLSIFGFFGFRSLQSIEERVINSVTPKASDKAIQSAEQLLSNQLRGYLENADKRMDASEKNQETKISLFEKETATSLEKIVYGTMNKQFASLQNSIKEATEGAAKNEFNKSYADAVADFEAKSQEIEQLQKDYTTLRTLCDDYERRIQVLELRRGIKQAKKGDASDTITTDDYKRSSKRNPDPYNKK